MGNLVRAQWFRLLHGSSSGLFALTLVAVAGFVVVQFTAYWDDCGTFRAVLGRASVVEVYCVFVALYLAAFFAEDFQYGTVRNLMVGKGSRRAWALSALVVTFGCALGAMLLGAVVTGVVYGLMGGAPVAFDIGELAAWWLVASLLATAFSVVAVAVTVVVPWAPLTTAVVAATLLTSGLGYWFCQAAAVGLPAPLASFVTEGVLPLTLTALRLSLLNGAPIEPWWFADLALVLVASVIIIAAALNRKELRQS